MRKLAVVGAAVLGAMLAVAGIAYAANTYTSTGKITPSKSGTSAKPTPIAIALTFTVGDTAGNRPSSLKTYAVGFGPGVVPNTAVAKGCNSTQANKQILPSTCSKRASAGGANIGTGSVNALAGTSTDPTQKIPCFLKVTLVNSTKRNHLWIRVDGVTSGPPGKTCPLAQHSAIDATFTKLRSVPKKGGGTVPSYALKFTVPPNLIRNSGLDVAVIHDVTNVSKVSKRIGRVTHGYLETVGCPKTPSGKRKADVTFTSAAGQTVTSSSTSACS